MRVLGMDTCGGEATVAVGVVSAAGVEVLGERRMAGRSASERLVGEMRGCCEEAGWGVREVEAVVVVRGPGSFTGVRVGVSAAKGLVEATGAGLVAVSRLRVLAGMGGAEGRVWAVLDAGRGEMFCGLYVDGVMVEEGLRTAEEVWSGVRAGETVVACEAGVVERLAGLAGVRAMAAPGAVEAMRLAAERVLRGEFADVAMVDGYYLRRTEAEMLERMRGQGTAVR